MVIEEVESEEEEEEEIENVEVEKPFVNGHSEQNETAAKPVADSISTQGKLSSQESDSSRANLKEPSESPSPAQESISALSHQETAGSQVGSSENDTQTQCSSSGKSPSLEDDSVSIAGSSALTATAEKPSSSDDTSSQNTEMPSPSPSPSLQPSEQSPSKPVSNVPPNQFSRPRFIQKSLPPEIQKLKDEGNHLFRSGQYANAIEQYSRAISTLEKGKSPET